MDADMTTVNLEYSHRLLITALQGLAAGKGPRDWQTIDNDYGRKTEIITALCRGTRLPGSFSDDALDLVDKAFAEIGVTRPRNRKDECALALIKALDEPLSLTQGFSKIPTAETS